MKKNKKYWKQQAKSWREIAEMETESANHWAGEAMIVAEELDELRVKFMKLKNELDIVRQYNIGKKQSGITHTNNPSVEAKVISLWSKNTPKNPSKKCNCDK